MIAKKNIKKNELLLEELAMEINTFELQILIKMNSVLFTFKIILNERLALERNLNVTLRMYTRLNLKSNTVTF